MPENNELERTLWQAAAAQWQPGAELDWVDQWAAVLGLEGWYTWQAGTRRRRWTRPLGRPLRVRRSAPCG